MTQPYIDEVIDTKTWIRTFDNTITESKDYIWHRDRNDRSIEVLEGTGWKFQFDNELPQIINNNDKIVIPKMIYHRIIPGNSKLKVKIYEEL